MAKATTTATNEPVETSPVPTELEIQTQELTPGKERDSLIAKAREIGVGERRIAATYRGDCNQQVGEQVQLLHRLIVRHMDREAHPHVSLLSRMRAAIGL